jgi:RNA polymerase sigma-70 factor, ECF subfamily
MHLDGNDCDSERQRSRTVRGHIQYIPESQVGKAIDMFSQYEAQFADISESQKMNSLMSSLNNATAAEHGPTSLQVSVVAAGGNYKSNSSEMSETALVSMAKFGDSDAFVVLSRLHSNRILLTIYNITRNWHDAEDALQDTMLRAFSHLKDFQEKSSFSTWLTRIAINSALMILRKKRGRSEISFEGNDDSGDNNQRWEVESPAESPESRLARKEREELLRDAIVRLPQALRETVELRQATECSTREIAQALGITVPAVKSRLSRARLTLRAALSSTRGGSSTGAPNAGST